MATEAGSVEKLGSTERKNKTVLTQTGLLMEGVRVLGEVSGEKLISPNPVSG
jgi:hypothetical protein